MSITQALSTALSGLNAAQTGLALVAGNVANAQTLFSSNGGNNKAFDNLAGTNAPPSFDWGLPFFFGRRVFTAIDGQSTPAGKGPYFAY